MRAFVLLLLLLWVTSGWPRSAWAQSSFRSDPDSLQAYGIAASLSGGFVQARGVGLGSFAGSRLPTPLLGVDMELRGVGWSAGAEVRPFYQWRDGWRIAASFAPMAFGGLRLEHRAFSKDVSLELGRGLLAALEGSVGKAFDAGWSFPYADVGLAGQCISVSAELSLASRGYLGNAELYGFGLAPFVRAGWYVPIDRDFYFDLSARYRGWGLMGAELGLGVGMSD